MQADPHEIQRWSCYVDDMDEDTVHLVMVDMTGKDGDGEEIGSFPRHLLEHLAPVRGQYVTVKVMSDETIVIEGTVLGDRDREHARQDAAMLVEPLDAPAAPHEDDMSNNTATS